MAMTLFNRLGIKGLSLNINSIGCPKCRPEYHKALKNYLAEHLDKLCSTCNTRFDRNPLRILDCKEDKCKTVVKDAPVMLDYLCDECKNHFEDLKKFLEAAKIEYTVNPMIVRGLDYYTKTVFEIISTDIGSQGTVCGGGRYDALVAECGGPDVAGAGFGLGLERLLLVLESQGIEIPKPNVCDVYFVTIGENAKEKAFELMLNCRAYGISADMDHVGRSVKAQFKYANKIGSPGYAFGMMKLKII